MTISLLMVGSLQTSQTEYLIILNQYFLHTSCFIFIYNKINYLRISSICDKKSYGQNVQHEVVYYLFCVIFQPWLGVTRRRSVEYRICIRHIHYWWYRNNNILINYIKQWTGFCTFLAVNSFWSSYIYVCISNIFISRKWW